VLASPVRRWISENPEQLLAPYVKKGMTVLEPGPGMGFSQFLWRAWLAMQDASWPWISSQRCLRRSSAVRAGLNVRIKTRLAKPESMGLDDLKGAVDFVLAFAVVHEMPSAERFFQEAAAVLKPGALLLFAEPASHVPPEKLELELDNAKLAGLEVVHRPAIRRSRAGLLRKI
jgi:SAM-dependent methyltransferase